MKTHREGSLFISVVSCVYNGKSINNISTTKTVVVGEDVKLTCPRQTSDYTSKIFWIRLVSGNFTELLGGTYSFHDHNRVNKTPRFTTKQEPGTFLLYINETEQSDTGLYYCIDTDKLDLKFLTGTFLRIKEEPEITTNFQLPPSDPVRPGDSVTLQCSVLFDSEKKTCPGDHSVYWFRAGSDEAHPSFIYAHGNNRDHCKKSPESESTQKCDYFFSKNISSSDAGTHYCAVATCGEILFGNGTKLEIEDVTCTLFIFYFYKNFIIFISYQIIMNFISLIKHWMMSESTDHSLVFETGKITDIIFFISNFIFHIMILVTMFYLMLIEFLVLCLLH
uniref:Ig-like domain-containing protein n=1 Tax=Echeneis naucrates TaxID=173247 RepID=A0A665WCM5_ECHNA